MTVGINNGALTLGSALTTANGGTGITSSHTPVQVVTTNTTAYAALSTVISTADSIPQNTAGDQIMTLSITPTNSSNLLVLFANIVVGWGSGPHAISMALFQDSTANALAAVSITSTANYQATLPLLYYMTAGTTSSTTFKLRAGPNVSATDYLNGISGARIFGGVSMSSFTITEYAA